MRLRQVYGSGVSRSENLERRGLFWCDMRVKGRKNEARAEWDIEPYSRSVDESPIFHAIKVAPGTGRWHTKGQAGHAASRASGHVVDEFEARLSNEIGVVRRSQMKQRRKNGKSSQEK